MNFRLSSVRSVYKLNTFMCLWSGARLLDYENRFCTPAPDFHRYVILSYIHVTDFVTMSCNITSVSRDNNDSN